MKNADTATGFALKTLLVVCTVWSVAVLYAFFTSRLPGKLLQLLTGH